MGQNNRLQRCLTTIESQMVMRELHEGPSRRHFGTEIMQRKIFIMRNHVCRNHITLHLKLKKIFCYVIIP